MRRPKLARYLLSFTGDAHYGDGLERVLYNTILGAKDPDGDSDFFYYSSYGSACAEIVLQIQGAVLRRARLCRLSPITF
jgi:hypothetical protein